MRNALLSFFHKAPTVERGKGELETPSDAESLSRDLATTEIDARFREALRKGEIMGDVVMVDEQGNPIPGQPKRMNILDL